LLRSSFPSHTHSIRPSEFIARICKASMRIDKINLAPLIGANLCGCDGLADACFSTQASGTLGIKAPLDASVFSAAVGAFLLASCGDYPFSIDQLQRYSLSTSSSKEK
jgi:hypothetical protein